MNLGETALHRWISQVQAENQGYVLSGSKPISAEQQRIRELENRVKELELDKDIIKKATAILSAYYAQLKQPQKPQKHTALTVEIKSVFKESQGSAGKRSIQSNPIQSNPIQATQ
ncbi:transposase [Chelonobacter oris]|uniref:transposase n=1 Tax=Chelonobacter oris TaxID=505317 RepID=UPI00244B5827|nr:transposase [Chelonobacter oris]